MVAAVQHTHEQRSMTTRADRWAACLVALMCVAMCWGVRYVFNHPAGAPPAMASTDHPHLP